MPRDNGASIMFISKFIVTSWGTMVAAAASSISNATNPVVNLGSAGSYLGVLQNNGTYVIVLLSNHSSLDLYFG